MQGDLTYLDMSSFYGFILNFMSAIKISSKVEESAWKNLRELAKESNQSISGVLTEAIEDYLRRHRVRPEVMKHLEDSMNAHESLGQKLAQ